MKNGKQQTSFDSLTDEALVELSRTGNDEAMDYLLKKYNPMVKREARTMFLIGGDTEDLIQEGMIGLFRAVKDFDAAQNAAFSTFARLCIVRKIYSAVTASNRKKHDALNHALSIDEEQGGENQTVLADFLEAGADSNPESFFIGQEEASLLQKKMKDALSKMEYQVIQAYIDGGSYAEIGEKLDKTPKQIDNAINRVRAKLARMIYG